MWLDLLIILVLIVGEGLFAGAKMAMVTLRRSQVESMAARGRRGRSVQRLLADPSQYLSAVQIGVTLTALLAAAFGAVTVLDSAERGLQRQAARSRRLRHPRRRLTARTEDARASHRHGAHDFK
jgi:putative hemolysin